MLRVLSAVTATVFLLTNTAFGEDLTIHFVGAAFSLRTETAQNDNFQSQASRVRWDVVMPGSINDNGFVSINGPQVKLRNIDGSKVYKTKNGLGDCTGDYSDYDPAHAPSSAALDRLLGNIAYTSVARPSNIYQDTSQAGNACALPDFAIFALFPDGSALPGSNIQNTFFPTSYQLDDPQFPGSNVDNHLLYAEFPINVNTPAGGAYSFTFTQNATAGTTTNKVVWFGQVTVFSGHVTPPAEDGYTLGGYIPPSDPSQPPNDPPTNLGGGGGGGSNPLGSTIKSWIKDSIDTLVGGILSVLRGGGASPLKLPELVSLDGGTVDIDSAAGTATGVTSANAPYSGTLKLSMVFTNKKTGKTKTVKLGSFSTVADSPTTMIFNTAGKLGKVLNAKGKLKFVLKATFKANGSKKVFTVSRKFKIS